MRKIVISLVFILSTAVLVEGHSISGNTTDKILKLIQDSNMKALQDIRIDLQPVGRFLRWISQRKSSDVGDARIIFRVLFQEKMMYGAMFIIGSLLVLSLGGLWMGSQSIGLGMGVMGINMAVLMWRLLNNRNGNGNGNGNTNGNGNGVNGNANGMAMLTTMGLLNRMGTNGGTALRIPNGASVEINGDTITTQRPAATNAPAMILFANGNGQSGPVVPLFNAELTASTPTISRIDNFGNLGNVGNLGTFGNLGTIGSLGTIGNLGTMGNLGNIIGFARIPVRQ
ncbi:uncharacterized protein LOC129795780 [Lutzomyia longipalpis]|uniref:uncharacterized protein LOC129795780 n=1 Tax=Lutzomyia longipalpis TaxID=7200 RepID=UPI002483756E|nr:uncharacterized protein LOC129795780 [Lutzomyia longipalpis]